MRILAELRDAPATVSRVAERLAVHPANLSRHMRVLEDAGLITRVAHKEGGVEKFYRAVARRFEVAPDSSSGQAAHAIALGMVKSDLADAAERLAGEEARVITALLGRANIPQEQAAAFARELRTLVERFRASEGVGEPYHINVSLYPGGEWEGPLGPIELKKKQ